MKATEAPIIVEQAFDVPPEEVWNAITDAERMKQWFFSQMKEFEPTVGFETRFDVECEGRNYRHVWKLVEVVPHERIVYDWSYEGREGRGLVAWDLEATTSGTRLTLTNTIVEDFEEDPAFTREACNGGWQYFVQQQLKTHLG